VINILTRGANPEERPSFKLQLDLLNQLLAEFLTNPGEYKIAEKKR
jgi:hypothetical protein